MKRPALLVLLLILASLSYVPGTTVSALATVELAPAGTTLGPDNYTWNRLTTAGTVSGQFVPFRSYRFRTTSAGDYTVTMETSGFPGAFFLFAYTFDPGGTNRYDGPASDPQFAANCVDSAEAASAGTLSETVTGLSANQEYEVVFATKAAGQSGTFSASISGPAAVLLGAPPFSIMDQPEGKSILAGGSATLRVYACGPWPQTFQWYRGFAGDTSSPIAGATSPSVTVSPASNTYYWVRITGPVGTSPATRDSGTAPVLISSTRSVPYAGQLDAYDDTFHRVVTFCTDVSTANHHFEIVRFEVPNGGDYTITLTSSDFAPAFDVYTQWFFPGTPCLNYWTNGVAGATPGTISLTTHFNGIETGPGSNWYDLVVSTTNGGDVGRYTVTIASPGSLPLVRILQPPPLTILNNPLDRAVEPGWPTALSVSPYGGKTPRTYRWYQGVTGDTSNPVTGPITGPAGQTYTTPNLGAETKYWVRVTDPDTSVDSDTATVYVYTPPLVYSNRFTACEETLGGEVYYRIYGFKVSTDGSYTLSVSKTGGAHITVYQSIFMPSNPSLNVYASGDNSVTEGFLAMPNTYYAVITSFSPGDFTLTITGADLVVPQPPPLVNPEPQDQVILRGQTATVSFATSTSGASIQWFTGSCPAGRMAISGATTTSYTTPVLTDYANYWAKLTKGIQYTLTRVARVKIKPQALADSFTIDEDTILSPATRGILANDDATKADSKTLTSVKLTNPAHGAFAPFNSDGSFAYTPTLNYNGSDSFTYYAWDGETASDPGTVSFTIREINDPPVRTGGSLDNLTVAEDSGVTPLGLLSLAYGAGGGSDEAGQTLTYRVTAVPPSTFGDVLLTSGATVTADTTYSLEQIQNMWFRPAPDASGGPHAFTFTVTDDGTSRGVADPQTLTQTLGITITPIPDPPSVTGATTFEDTQTTSGLVLTPHAGEVGLVTHFKIANIHNGTLYKSDGATPIGNGAFITAAEGGAGLKFTPALNLNSPGAVFDFDVFASTSDSQSGVGPTPTKATITVTPVNDAPSFVKGADQTVLANSGAFTVTGWATGLSPGPADESGQTVSFVVTTDNAELFATQPAVGSDGTLGFGTATDAAGSATVDVMLQDTGGTSNGGQDVSAVQSFTITVSKCDTTTTIDSVSPSPSDKGQTVTVVYSVAVNAPGSGSPAGTVTVGDGVDSCTGPAPAGSCTLALTTSGERTLTATYGGGSAYNGSTGSMVHTVNPSITIKNASIAEPASGSTVATFAVALSNPPSAPVTVDFATAADTGESPATADDDYTSTSGTLTFGPGERLKTISVPVLADAAGEPDETFLVLLSAPAGATIDKGTAIGTIASSASTAEVLISELRASGPDGSADEFVELYNNTDAEVAIGGWSIVQSGLACSEDPQIVAVFPAGTTIAPRGHYLVAGFGYGLGACAAGDLTLPLGTEIRADASVGLFRTSDVAELCSETRVDAVGFGDNTGGNCALLGEGTPIAATGGSTSQYSVVRMVRGDLGRGNEVNQDTCDNAADFRVVSTTAAAVGDTTSPLLGAPGPQGSSSPVGPAPCDAAGEAKLGRERTDPAAALGAAPNRERDTTSYTDTLSGTGTYPNGTLTIRRRFVNNTGGDITQLRFRVLSLTTYNSPLASAPDPQADLRAVTSAAETLSVPGRGTVEVVGLTLDQPPAQPNGGGANATLSVALGTPLADGAGVDVALRFGVSAVGNYHAGIALETLTSNGAVGKDVWVLAGDTEAGGETEGGCNAAPVAAAGGDRTVECQGNVTSVTLDGTASVDPDGDTPLTYEWREGDTLLGTGVTLTVSLASGPHTITLTVTDPMGAFGQDTAVIDVGDTTGPTIVVNPHTLTMTAPNSAYRTFDVADLVASVSDACDVSVGLGSVVITQVTSDEAENAPGNGDGNTMADIVIAADCRSVRLRSEWDKASNGRVYTIYLSVVDGSGHATTAAKTVEARNKKGTAVLGPGPGYSVTSNCP